MGHVSVLFEHGAAVVSNTLCGCWNVGYIFAQKNQKLFPKFFGSSSPIFIGFVFFIQQGTQDGKFRQSLLQATYTTVTFSCSRSHTFQYVEHGFHVTHCR